jgi:hypothetical protein
VLFIQSPRFSIVLHSYKKVIISMRYRSIPLLLYSINHISLIPSSIKPTPKKKNYPRLFVFGNFRFVNLIFNCTPFENNLNMKVVFEGCTPYCSN